MRRSEKIAGVRAAPLVAVVIALAACGGNGGDDASTIPVGKVDPGTYKGEPFEPALRLTIAEQGWRALFAPEDDELAFEHEDGRFLAFTHATRVVDPKTGRDVPAPTDLAEWLRKHPALQPTQAVPISVGGSSGTRVDASPTQSDTDIFWYPSGAMHTVPQVRWRVFVVDAHGTPLTIVYAAPIASFDQALTQLEPLLESVEFD